MNVAVEEINPCRRRLRIEVPPNEVNEEIERITGEFQKWAKIPGFRPGKAPKAVIAKRFEKEIDEEVRRSVAPKAYRKAVADKKLRVVSAPQIEEMKFERGLSLSFSTVVDLAPDIRLPQYKGIPLKAVVEGAADEEVDKTMEAVREQHAEFEDVAGRAVEAGDFAVVSFTAACEGRPLLEVAPAAKALAARENLWVHVEADAFLPGFGAQITGLGIGDRKDVQVEFPADFPHAELRGKNAVFFTEIKGLKRKVLPALDDALARKAAGKDLEALRAEIRERIAEEKAAEAEVQRRNEVVDYLLGRVDFDLPESVVQAQTRSVIRRIVEENSVRGVPAETLQSKKDEIYQMAAKSARDRVKASFLVTRIAEAEKIEVTQEEMNRRLQQLAVRYGMTARKLAEELEKHDGLGQIEEELLIGKTLDFLVAEAKVGGE